MKIGNYKVINPDGTFYTFVTSGMGDHSKDTAIAQYGSYEITSDSIMVEHVIKHVLTPSLNGKDGQIKYQMIDEKHHGIMITLCYVGVVSIFWFSVLLDLFIYRLI